MAAVLYDFEIGDTVQLKGGGPLREISNIHNSHVKMYLWFKNCLGPEAAEHYVLVNRPIPPLPDHSEEVNKIYSDWIMRRIKKHG